MYQEKYENLSYTVELRGDVSEYQQKYLIHYLMIRFKDKPRVCKKVNDSLIGSSKRIVYVSGDTFFYYQMIQEFQDLDIGKLEYSIPKAGIKLTDIVSMSFPPRKKKYKNYFMLVVPKNKILKYGKNKEVVIDPKAKGYLNWTFVFAYDIVSLPEREERVYRELARQKEVQQKQKEEEIKEKERLERELAERKKAEEERQKKFYSFLQYKDMVKREDEILMEEAQKEKQKKQEPTETELQSGYLTQAKKRIEGAFEYRFTTTYLKLTKKMSLEEMMKVEYQLLEIIGSFRMKAIYNTKLLISELLFNKNIQLYSETTEKGYFVNDMWIRLGGKNLNQYFLGMFNVADILSILKKNRGVEIRVPLAALIKYQGYKALCTVNISISGDYSIIYGLPTEGGFKINSSISDELKDICKGLNLRPYISEIRMNNITVFLDPRCQVHESVSNPFSYIYKISGLPISVYKVQYITNLKYIFPVDVDLENSINQTHVRLRPYYVHSTYEYPLSSGAFLYSVDNPDGYVEDLAVARASYALRYKSLPQFVKRLDNLDILLIDSRTIVEAMHSNGINIRYMGKISKMTELPYVRELMHIEMISRTIKKIFRQQLVEFQQEGFRKANPSIYQQLQMETEKLMSKRGGKEKPAESAFIALKKKYVIEKFNTSTQSIAIDFLNLVFGDTEYTKVFWGIIKNKVLEQYEVEIEVMPTVSAGALLHAVLYHCAIQIKFDINVKLFLSDEPFKEADWVGFCVDSRVFEYPSFEIQKMARKSKMYTVDNKLIYLGMNSLNLYLSVNRALKASDHYLHCALPYQSILVKLAQYTSVKQPEGPLYHPYVLPYFIANVNYYNFLKAHYVSEFCIPYTHPLFISFYMAYSRLHDRDVLYRSALLVAIRGLGVSHWKTCYLLSLADAGNLESLRKAWISSKETSGMAALTLVKKLFQIGKLAECLEFCDKGFKIFIQKPQNFPKEINYLLSVAIQAAYQMRYVDKMLDYSEKLWKNLYNSDRSNMQMYDLLYWYSFKVFLETSRFKKYFYKLILVLRDYIVKEYLPIKHKENSNVSQNEEYDRYGMEEEFVEPVYFPPAEGKERYEILNTIMSLSRYSKYHIDWIKSVLNKIEYGHKTLNYTKNFFTKFQDHLDNLNNEDLEDGLQSLFLVGRLYGQKYFEEALISGIFHEPHRKPTDY